MKPTESLGVTTLKPSQLEHLLLVWHSFGIRQYLYCYHGSGGQRTEWVESGAWVTTAFNFAGVDQVIFDDVAIGIRQKS